jgi:hypothetical protein
LPPHTHRRRPLDSLTGQNQYHDSPGAQFDPPPDHSTSQHGHIAAFDNFRFVFDHLRPMLDKLRPMFDNTRSIIFDKFRQFFNNIRLSTHAQQIATNFRPRPTFDQFRPMLVIFVDNVQPLSTIFDIFRPRTTNARKIATNARQFSNHLGPIPPDPKSRIFLNVIRIWTRKN